MLYVHVKYNPLGPGENTNLFCCLHLCGRVDLHMVLYCYVTLCTVVSSTFFTVPRTILRGVIIFLAETALKTASEFFYKGKNRA
jgi:hypothetical protein